MMTFCRVLVALTLLGPAVVLAYVRSISVDSQQPLSWTGTNCVKVRPSATGTPDVPGALELDAIRQAADNWNQATASCAFLRLVVLEPKESVGIGFNAQGRNENTISWVEKAYSRTCQRDGDCDEEEFCDGCGGVYGSCDTSQDRGGCCPRGSHCWVHDLKAAAITTVFFVDEEGHAEDGRILDADIELNGAHRFFFTVNGSSNGTDVQNTVTHELGHLLGLDHPCDDGARRPLPRDHLGQTLPSCDPASALPAEMKQTTMYNFTDPGETRKRTPEADDVLGVCSTYPLAQDPGQCVDVDLTPGCACSALGARPAGQGPRVAGVPLMPVLALAVPVLLLWLRRRRSAG